MGDLERVGFIKAHHLLVSARTFDTKFLVFMNFINFVCSSEFRSFSRGVGLSNLHWPFYIFAVCRVSRLLDERLSLSTKKVL